MFISFVLALLGLLPLAFGPLLGERERKKREERYLAISKISLFLFGAAWDTEENKYWPWSELLIYLYR